MPLEQRDKELAAIGASIGANCRPCIEHHLAAGRDAGLSDFELDDAVATAHAVRGQAVDLLAARIDVLLGHGGPPPAPTALAETIPCPIVVRGGRRKQVAVPREEVRRHDG